MRVLSLFDGIACGYEALQRVGIPIDVYYASEIDKYAIQIAQKNHPDIIQLGDVCEIKGGGNLKDIDLIMWGSPCQGFSIAGKMLNFNDPRSKLFFEFVRLVKEIKPKYFLLENVKMKKERIDIISSELWVQPIEINSGLVSAQNRRRLYRTNIPGVSQPKDKGILLKDILQHEVDEKYMFSRERRERIVNWKYDILKRLENKEGKCATLVTNGGGNHEKKIEVSYSPNELVEIVDGEVRIKQATKKGYIVAEEGDGISFSFNNSSSSRSRMGKGKANTITCNWDSYVYEPSVVHVPNIVKVRKCEVDIEGLKEELRSHKTISNKEIAEKLDLPKTKVDHRFRIDSCFAIPDPEIRFRLKDLLGITTDKYDKSITEFEERPGTYEKSERKINVEGKMSTLTTSQNDEIINGSVIRKLTPVECERLQTLPDNYTAWVSDSQRYKALGNWRTVDVIAHIFSFIK